MREDIKKRIEAVRHGEAPAGYRVENSYLIPNNWKTVPFNSRFVRSTRKNTSNCDNVLTISAQMGLVNQREFYDKDIASENKSGYFLLENGEYAYNKSYSTGYPYGAIKQLTKYDKGVVSPLYICFAPKTDTDTAFYTQYFEGGRYNREIYRIAQEGARNHGLLNIAVEDFFTGTLVEPSMVEQQKIAEILSTCDQVIELKQKLLEEKRRQKQWLMQKLLNPDSGVRLPGFEGSMWQAFRLGDITDIYSGGTPDTGTDAYWHGDVLWCIPSDISRAGKYIDKTETSISELGLHKSSAVLLPAGTVLMCSRATIGPRSIAKVPIATNQGFKNFVCKKSLNNEFLYYALDRIIPEFLKKAAGNTFKEVSKTDIANTKLIIPDLNEQKAIALRLAVADKELDLIEREVVSWQQKKKALMQLLLTGLVRVNA